METADVDCFSPKEIRSMAAEINYLVQEKLDCDSE